MRKRAFHAVLLLFALLAPLTAHSAKLKTVNIDWHTSLAASFWSQGDSATIFRGTQTGLTVLPSDTSGTIDLRRWVLPGALPTTAAQDTMAWLRLSVHPIATTPTVESTTDTLHLQIQVSENNITWHRVTFTTRISPLQVTMFAAAVLDVDTNSGVFVFPIRQLIGATTLQIFSQTAVGGTAPLEYQLFGWNYMRIICQGDFSGQYDAELTGFVPDND